MYWQMDQQLHTKFFLPWLSLDYCKHSGMQGNIFDSPYCEVDVASKKAIANVFPDSDISFNVPSVPVQLEADDCGL